MFLGIGLAVTGGMVFNNSDVSLSGWILFGTALLGLILTQGRRKEKILGKILGGFGSLYSLLDYLSGILSYMRLFGLGLTSVVIGGVANQLAGVMFGMIPVAGYLIGIIIIVFLHGLNIGISTIGAYLHNSRLQFIEFFGRFYEGNGREFSPMGVKTKYTRVA